PAGSRRISFKKDLSKSSSTEPWKSVLLRNGLKLDFQQIPLSNLYRFTEFFELLQAVWIAKVPFLLRSEGEHMVIPGRHTSDGAGSTGIGTAFGIKRHLRLTGWIGKKHD